MKKGFFAAAVVRMTARGLCPAAIALASTPAVAQDENAKPVRFDGLVELRLAHSGIEVEESDEADSSGIGAHIRLGAQIALDQKTEIRIEGEARRFEYKDETRDALETLIGRASITRQVSDEVELRAHFRRYGNIAVLESFSADQTSIGARVQWQSGNDRFQLEGEYREREYDTGALSNSSGYRASAQYNRRFGSYHWLRFDLAQESMRSDNTPRRNFDRLRARVKYSHPVHRRVRLRPSIEYRRWDYDSRIARGDPQGDLREDSYVAPGIELSVGSSTRGFHGLASVEYRIRDSNDERFGDNALRAGISLTYRF